MGESRWERAMFLSPESFRTRSLNTIQDSFELSKLSSFPSNNVKLGERRISGTSTSRFSASVVCGGYEYGSKAIVCVSPSSLEMFHLCYAGSIVGSASYVPQACSELIVRMYDDNRCVIAVAKYDVLGILSMKAPVLIETEPYGDEPPVNLGVYTRYYGSLRCAAVSGDSMMDKMVTMKIPSNDPVDMRYDAMLDI